MSQSNFCYLSVYEFHLKTSMFNDLVNTWTELQALGGKSLYHYRIKAESSQLKPIIESQSSLIDHRNLDVHTDQ